MSLQRIRLWATPVEEGYLFFQLFFVHVIAAPLLPVNAVHFLYIRHQTRLKYYQYSYEKHSRHV